MIDLLSKKVTAGIGFVKALGGRSYEDGLIGQGDNCWCIGFFEFESILILTVFQMQKNKGLLHKRKKEAKHSRVKRRAQYKKALIKRRSQIPDVKREMNKYTGEARGIRMSTVRSVPLKG